MGTVRVGLSGWNYDAWRGDFYPPGLARTKQLAYAAAHVDSIEVNGTFYGLVSPDSFRRWRAEVPRGFVFAVKGSRFITHNKKLRDAEGPLANFFASGVLELDETLGPFLWQLPATLHFDADRIESFLTLLPRHTAEARALAERHDDRVRKVAYGPGTPRRLRHVLEVRHASWLCDEMVRIARRHGVALAASHSAEWPYTEELTAGFAYVRLHGPALLYGSAYGATSLRAWADRIRRWHAGTEPDDAVRVGARMPPRRTQRDVYVYFDNDMGGHAPREAMALRAILDQR